MCRTSGTVDVEQGPGITYATPSEGKRIKYDDWNTALGSGWDSTRTISTPDATYCSVV